MYSKQYIYYVVFIKIVYIYYYVQENTNDSKKLMNMFGNDKKRKSMNVQQAFKSKQFLETHTNKIS